MLAALVLGPGTARAQATATFVNPIGIAKTADLDFGAVIPANVPGTVTVTPTPQGGSRGGTNVTFFGTAGFSQAEFGVTGDAGAFFTITLPTSITVDTVSGPAASMTVDTFTSVPSGTGQIGNRGSAKLFMGATLHVGASQTAGSYSGSFTVTVAYQ